MRTTIVLCLDSEAPLSDADMRDLARSAAASIVDHRVVEASAVRASDGKVVFHDDVDRVNIAGIVYDIAPNGALSIHQEV